MTKIAAVMTFIEPILMALIAGLVGSIVAAIYLPLIDLVTVLGNS